VRQDAHRDPVREENLGRSPTILRHPEKNTQTAPPSAPFRPTHRDPFGFSSPFTEAPRLCLVPVQTMENSQSQEPPAPSSLPPQADLSSPEPLQEPSSLPVQTQAHDQAQDSDPSPLPPSAGPTEAPEAPALNAEESSDTPPSSPTDPLLETTEVTPDSLEDFALRSRRARLSLEEETQASELLRSTLLSGRAEVARAIQIIPSLPWVITAQGASNAWPEMKPSFRSQLLAGLARAEGDHAARIRLSLARALLKVDPAATLKLILLTLKVLRDKSTGLLIGKGAPAFANVLIGRGKAWLLQLPTAELKPAELDLLVNAALHAAFHAPQAPISQISVIKWAASLGRLSDRPAALDQLISRGLSKWSGKWQALLQKDVDSLPASWTQGFKTSPRSHPASQENPNTDSEPASEESPEVTPSGAGEEETPETRRPSRSRDRSERGNRYESRHRRAEPEARETEESLSESEDSSEETDEEDEDRESEEHENGEDQEETSLQTGPTGRPRPVYVSKTIPSHSSAYPPHPPSAYPAATSSSGTSRRGGLASASFNLSETLRQIEQYAAGLRSELHAAQKQLRQRDDDRRNRRPERPQVIPGEPSVEELARLNQQLETRNAELTARLEELSADSEERAVSRGLITDAPEPDANTQLRALLGFKLRDDFEDFQALEEASKDLVVQQHYPSLLRHIFEVLQQEGVVFPPPEQRPEA
jgi:hypothetical protein